MALIRVQHLSPYAIRWISFSRSSVGFGSTIVNLLGLAEYCERHEIDLHFDPRGILIPYLDGESDPWREVFASDSIPSDSIRYGHDRKYGVSLSLPPSFPFFDYMNCCDDRTLFISNRWAQSFNMILHKHLPFSSRIEAATVEDRKTLDGSRILGVHMRGTDHAAHGRTLSIEERIFQLDSHFGSGGFDSIFLMTDERRYLEAAISKFGRKVKFLPEVERSDSTHPLHHDRKVANGTKILTDLVRESRLMSMCDGQLLCRSGVSAFVRCLRPSVPFHLFQEDLTNHDLMGWKNNIQGDSIINCVPLR